MTMHSHSPESAPNSTLDRAHPPAVALVEVEMAAPAATTSGGATCQLATTVA